MRGQARGACGLHVKELSVNGSEMRTRPRLSDEVTKCVGRHAKSEPDGMPVFGIRERKEHILNVE